MMSNDGTWKIKQKKVHFSGKPYERSESKSRDEYSFLGKVKETVRNLFAPSWFVSKTTPTAPQANATSGALIEQLTAPPLNAGEDLYTSTPKKPTTETNDVTPHPYQISHRFVSPTPAEHNSVPQQRSVSVPYLTHLGGQRIGNSLQPFTPRVNSRPPEIRVSTPYPHPSDPPPEPRPSTSRDEPDSTRTREESRLDLSQSSFLGTNAEPRPSHSEPVYRARTSFLDTSVEHSLSKAAKPTEPKMSKPSFNISLFSNSRLVNDQTTSLLGIEAQKSPYYPGKTLYGGASSHRKTSLNPGQPYSRNVGIRKMAAKTSPNNAAGTVTSSTARKILDALDSMSSVLGDAKKVPLNTSSMMESPAPYTPRSYGRSSRRQTPGGAPPIGRLSTPGAASIATNRQSNLLRETADISARPRLPEYAGPSSSMQTPVLPRSGKMRREKSGLHYKAARDDDDEESDYLNSDLTQPSFQLPVPVNFSLSAFGSPRTNEANSGTRSNSTTTTGSSGSSSKESADRLRAQGVGQSASPFRFASPMAETPPSTGESGTTVTNQGFQFSSPVAVSQTVKNDRTMSGINGPTSFNAVTNIGGQSFQFDVGKAKLKPKSSEAVEPKQAFGGPFGASPVMKQGSVLDALGGGSKAASSSKASSSSPGTTNDIAARFKPAVGSWECPVCMINNGAGKAQCLACGASGPERNATSATNKPCTKCGNLDSDTSSCSKCGESKSSSIPVKNDVKLAEKLKPVANHTPATWPCSECSKLNDEFRSSCVSCQARRGGRNGEQSSRWECPTCWVQNDGEASRCAACTEPHPKRAEKVGSQSIAERFKKPSGSWDCDVCMVFNESTAVKCMACETPRPGATSTSSGFSKAPSYQFGSAGAGGFKCEALSSNGGFTFGGQKVSGGVEAPSTGFKLPGASTDGFKFGGTDSGKPSVGFTFGATSDDKKDNASSSGFSFGASNDKKDSAPSLGFNLGAGNDKKDSAPNLGFSFGATNDKKESAPSLGFSFGASNDKKESAPSLGFSFGAPKDSDKKSSGFNAIAESKESTAIGGGLKFEVKDTLAQFGSTNDEPKPIGGFSFGNPDAKKGVEVTKADLPSTNAIAGLFKFGPMSNDVKTTETKPADKPTQGFAFGGPALTSTPSFGATAPSFGAPGLGAPAKTPSGESIVLGAKRKQSSDGPAAKKTAGFGTFPTNPSTTTSATPAPTVNQGLFGGQPTSTIATPAGPPTFLFGSTAATSGGSAFTFGAPKPEDIARGDVSKTPNFGAPPMNAAPPSFGSAQTAAPVFGGQEPGFGRTSTFGSGAVFGSTPATSATSFGAGASKPTFGAPGAPAPVFGQATPSPFGAASNATASFGAKPTGATTFSASNNPSSGFDFGSVTQPTTSSGGFNFGAATAPGAGGVFQFGGPSATTTGPPPPAYNFTQGPAGQAPAFSAIQPSNPFTPVSAHSNRKIKKAHRRR